MAHRNFAPVRALTRELVPVVGSFALGNTKASATLASIGDGKLDTVVEAVMPGGNDVKVVLVGDSTSGVTISIVDVGTPGDWVVIHFKPDTSTVSDVETAITALSGANAIIAVKTGGTGATVLTAGTVGNMLLTGGSTFAQKGLGFVVEHHHTAAGTFTVKLTDVWNELVSSKSTLQLASADDKFAQVLSADLAAKTITLGIWDKSGAGLTDVAADDNNRLNFVFWFRNSNATSARG